jgi:hypothetical protein
MDMFRTVSFGIRYGMCRKVSLCTWLKVKVTWQCAPYYSKLVGHKLFTYVVEYRALSGVFKNIDPPPPSPPFEWVLPPHHRRGGTHSPAGGVGGGGESIFWKMPDIGLASYSIISLRCGLYNVFHSIGMAVAKSITEGQYTVYLEISVSLFDVLLPVIFPVCCAVCAQLHQYSWQPEECSAGFMMVIKFYLRPLYLHTFYLFTHNYRQVLQFMSSYVGVFSGRLAHCWC